MAGIYLSYRRTDSAGYCGRLADDLEQRFPEFGVFRDVDSIEAGADCSEAIEHALRLATVVLAVICPRWLESKGAEDAGRAEGPEAVVRQEIASALRLGLRIIPVLVDGATAPQADDLPHDIRALAGRRALELSDLRWDYDVEQLCRRIERIAGVSARAPSRPGPEVGEARDAGTFLRFAAGTLAAIVAAGILGAFERPPAAVGPVKSHSAEPVPGPALSWNVLPFVDTLRDTSTRTGIHGSWREGEPDRIRMLSPLRHDSHRSLVDTPNPGQAAEGARLRFEEPRGKATVIGSRTRARQGLVEFPDGGGRQSVPALTAASEDLPQRWRPEPSNH